MLRLQLFLLFAGCQLLAYAQKEKTFDEKMKMELNKDYSFAHKNLFFEISLSPFTSYQYRNFSDSMTYTDNLKYARTEETSSYSILAFSVNPRVNLVSKNDFAVFLRSTISFNLSAHRTAVTLRNDQEGSYLTDRFKGFGHFEIPFYIGYARGLNSSYSNCSRNGLAIGLGYQLNKRWSKQKTIYYDLEDYEITNSFAYPVVRIDYYKLTKNKKMLGMYMGLGFINVLQVNLGFNFNISKK